ncbi:phenylacetic acid degradation bifunctional protein PaaZ [Jannaschia seohaensis]|uniref:Oxepin-CoA hydrolase / 3-oxo-5,6-dehydrosuberyl-CoA semialdehyde dehydrogenase n=1 Tax=Jannaschia seohaensis TaxID=475081 RepID=A0A2Y9A1R0_9RHOB|nr:phenylacetic acid degradation bifunctional protein PaaZ [Jannaschia seohaensis]PWJ21927.1 oxepin-CoA hydrolase/3-oxo-5,6-dehydrosuberyl-CoA semialdehyde dehydrogenase [Jannaschia seohaensis]SSA38205.1 oxepin-CoA hydrolase / 3-oxo-5,6-dehydrosuberyl-CoA semialdehyde dehydrogenase [Jannaschia seohaensis]
MTLMQVHSFAEGRWVPPGAEAREIESAVTGDIIARAGGAALDAQGMLDHARRVGGPALRALTFHDRARMLKALALHLTEHKQALYDISYATGATTRDHAFDIDGGIGTTFVYASKGRREMPDARVYLDGAPEQLSRTGTFLGQHVCVPLQGVAVHINAFNFPVWGMLEKLAPTLLAGVPAIVKPATATSYVTELAVRLILDSGILPPGALQFVAGGLGDMLDRLGPQDAVGFTGSAATALTLRSNPNLLANAVRFVAEQDSLNASILGPDAAPGTPEFDLFVKEAVREITTKAGQKCTATRRLIVPGALAQATIEALSGQLAKTRVGEPQDERTRMGALVSREQRQDVRAKIATLETEAERVHGDPDAFADRPGAFLPPILLHCADPDAARRLHDTEAFGPVSTVLPYRDLDHAVALANRGEGSLVASIITHDPEVAMQAVAGMAAWHGRLYFNDRESMSESTGHGAPMPHMVHGGPGRAGGGEELGGVRGVLHYMQRTAVQGSPTMLQAIGGRHVAGAATRPGPVHPFRRTFDDLAIGDTLTTEERVIRSEDIAHFAEFTGDTFYAHMDDAAAARNPFFPGRVAHGYLILSFAAGLFVAPEEGPVLANTGLDDLRFLKPAPPGTAIRVHLTVKGKTPRTSDYGEIRWAVRVVDGAGEAVAEYDLLTMVARGG